MQQVSNVTQSTTNEFDCACVIDTLTKHTIPAQIAALRESLELASKAWNGIGDIDGKTPRPHCADQLNGLSDIESENRADSDIVQAWFDQAARRREKTGA